MEPRRIEDAASRVGTHDLLFVTLDTLRFDVAMLALQRGSTPRLAGWLPASGWELRHTPGNFTFAAHQAFFAGFLPTPATPGPRPRLFAVEFPGSETINAKTAVFSEPDTIRGFAARGYHTLCIGGVGFFNPASPLGQVLPGYFAESHWRPEFSVAHRESTQAQVDLAIRRLEELPRDKRVLLFLNVSALHQPNCMYVEGVTKDSIETQAAALAYVDSHMGRLVDAMHARAPLMAVICSDHGTAYGEDGYHGHRLSHPVVWNVPYVDFVLE